MKNERGIKDLALIILFNFTVTKEMGANVIVENTGSNYFITFITVD